ncbi:MAG: hypothetical protein ACRD93_08640 [Nitrososphaeraceae archaeon]
MYKHIFNVKEPLVFVKIKLILPLLTIMTMTLAVISISYNVARADSHRDEDYCYDQVGDGHPCFDTKKECGHEQKNDEIAESPCYNQDRTE